MATAQTIITRAARALGYLGRTGVLSSADANDGLIILNAMLDSWSNEFLMSYEVQEQSFTLAVGQAAYTIGTTGSPNINLTRPLDITQAYIQDTGSNNYPMRILPRDKWNEIGNRGATITSQIPTDLFYDSQFPLGIINVFPTPLIAYTCFFDYTLDQVQFAALGTTLSMPVGYERAMVTNLAMELMANGYPCLLDEKGLAMLTAAARESKGNVKRTNIKEVIANYDPAVVSRSYATYNIYSDGRNGDF